MIYIKTTLGREALQERHSLNLRERQLMVLCNGVRTHAELLDLFGEAITEDINRLERKGYLIAQQDWQRSRPGPLEIAEAEKPLLAEASHAVPPSRFVASRFATESPPEPVAEQSRRLSLAELTELANVPAVRGAAIAPVRPTESEEASATTTAPADLATSVYSIDAEHMPVRSPVAAQAYMTQVLMALERPDATALIEDHGDVRHDVDVVLFLARGLGLTHTVAGEDITLRVALRASRLMPEAEVPMLLDCTLDYVPADFSVLLYEFVLAGRETGL